MIAAEPANSECAPRSAPASIAWVVGTQDAAMPWDGVEGGDGVGAMLSADQTIANWIDHMGCEAEPTIQDMADLDPQDHSTVQRQAWECPDGQALLRFEVIGGGHVVPSITEPVTGAWELLVGQQNHDIETADELWGFFEDHPRVTTGR